MKTKRQSHSGGWRQAVSVLLALALAVGLALGMPAPGGVAYAAPILGVEGDEGGANAGDETPAPGSGSLDLSRKCSVTVHFPTTMTGEDVTDLDLETTKADLYLIAPAVRLSGYDVYAYCINDAMPYYAAVETYLENTPNWRMQPLTSAPDGYTKPDWMTEEQEANAQNWLLFRYAPEDAQHASANEQERLAELLAKQLFVPEEAAPGEPAPQPLAGTTVTPAGTGNIEAAIGDLPAGLYLNVVHGSELSGKTLTPNEYAVLVQSQDEKDENNNPLQKICTVACSGTRVYTFQPQLLSLPGLVNETGDQITDTTAGGTWAYTMAVTAKGESANRFADLQLEKQLDALVEGGSAVFIFRVQAYAPEDAAFANPVYEKVITLRAESNNPDSLKSELITNRIPAGSTVVITEEYTGAGYEFKNAKVDAAWNDAHQTAPKPEISGRVTIAGNRITITDIPAGRIHLTAPSGEENILQDGTAETVTVTNAPGTPVNGGSVINSFTQDANGGWQWTKRHYDAQTGAWVNDPAKPVTQAGEG